MGRSLKFSVHDVLNVGHQGDSHAFRDAKKVIKEIVRSCADCCHRENLLSIKMNKTKLYVFISSACPFVKWIFLFYFKDSFNEKQSIINTALCCSRAPWFLKKLKTTTADFMAGWIAACL